ncbi:hypothetical protein Rcae01_02213 [Novipirellula caenicola]|uniref:Uncharacterized protein n=1 Tax=Novipirellula caenicola TaxID=1536901 RepID=A0ABP9VNJ6_9BACT
MPTSGTRFVSGRDRCGASCFSVHSSRQTCQFGWQNFCGVKYGTASENWQLHTFEMLREV